jgi:hypothetical protein
LTSNGFTKCLSKSLCSKWIICLKKSLCPLKTLYFVNEQDLIHYYYYSYK